MFLLLLTEGLKFVSRRLPNRKALKLLVDTNNFE